MPRAQIPIPEEQAQYKRSAAEVRRSLHFSTYYLRNPVASTIPTLDTNIAQRFGSEEVGSIFWPCLLAIVVGSFDWYRYGFSIHVGIVAIGIVLSLVIPFFLVIHCLKVIQGRASPAVAPMVFYTTVSFVPYMFALYLILFLGLYSCIAQFSLSQFVQSLLSIVAGHCIARKIRRLQEFQSCVYEESKMKDIWNCEVKDKELLACFKEKLKRWKTCLSDEKDCHSIYNQLTILFWDHAVYRTFNEARRLSEETNDPSTGLQGTIIELIDKNYMDSQTIAIRRLTDKRKDVVSLRSVIDEIYANTNLYIRENYVCYDSISYEEAPDDDHHIRHLRHSRQTRYDYLSEKDKDSRSRSDKLSSAILASMKKEIEEDFEITEKVCIYVNKWVAHAAHTKNRGKYTHVLDEVSLRKLDECYQALIRIGKKIELFIDKFLLCSVPTPQFDQLNNWDKPVVVTKDLDLLRKYWLSRCAEIENWAKRATIIHR